MHEESHIQRVEFFIALLSFVLIAGLISSRDNSTRKAVDQMEVVTGLLSKWDRFWLDTRIDSIVESGIDTSFARCWRVTRDSVPVGTIVLRRLWTIRPSLNQNVEDWLRRKDAGDPGARADGMYEPWRKPNGNLLPRPETLSEFRLVWDYLGGLDYWRVSSFEPDRYLLSSRPGNYLLESVLAKFQPVAPADGDTLDLRFRGEVGIAFSSLSGATWALYDTTLHVFHGRRVRVAVPTASSHQSIRLRSRLIKDYHLSLDDAAFDLAFPALTGAVQVYPTLPVDTVLTLLSEQADREVTDLTILGVTMRRRALGIFAPLLLLLAQLYYLAWLRFLTRSPQKRQERWIGGHRSMLPQFLSALAVVILPPIATLLALRAIDETATACVFALPSLLVSLMIAFDKRKYWRECICAP